MPPQPKQEDEDPKQQLIVALEERLGVTMGMRPPGLERLFGVYGAYRLAWTWLVLHSVIAAALLWPILDRLAQSPHPKLVGLILWGSLFFFAVIMISGLMTRRVVDIVGRDILRFASDEYAAAVSERLGNQSRLQLIRAGPFVLASIAWAAGAGALYLDIRPAAGAWPEMSPDLLIWAICSFYLYFTASRGMAASTFVFCFAGALEEEREFLFPFGVESPLVQGMARLNRNLLAYWAMNFLAAATILLLVLPGEPFFNAGSAYLFFLAPTVAGFSLGLSSFIYLRSEDIIGTAVRRYAFERADLLQREISGLLKGPVPANAAAAAKVERLVSLHDRILAEGRYQSRVGIAFSLVLPLVPVIAALAKLIELLRG